jgi:hypothetical protein
METIKLDRKYQTDSEREEFIFLLKKLIAAQEKIIQMQRELLNKNKGNLKIAWEK